MLLHRPDESEKKAKCPFCARQGRFALEEREEGLLPVGRLPVGVDAGVPLHRAMLFAGLGGFGRGGARRCGHGTGRKSAV